MKKLIILIASFIVGIICSVGLTGPQTPARVPEKVNEHVIVSSEDAAQRFSSARTNKDLFGTEEEVSASRSENQKTLTDSGGNTT